MKLTKSSTYVPAPGECEKCPYKNKCNGGEACFDYDGSVGRRNEYLKKYRRTVLEQKSNEKSL